MSGQRIQLEALRRRMTTKVYSGTSGSPDVGTPMPVWVTAGEVLALVEAVEAARNVSDDLQPSYDSRERLDRALAKFDFGGVS